MIPVKSQSDDETQNLRESSVNVLNFGNSAASNSTLSQDSANKSQLKRIDRKSHYQTTLSENLDLLRSNRIIIDM